MPDFSGASDIILGYALGAKKSGTEKSRFCASFFSGKTSASLNPGASRPQTHGQKEKINNNKINNK
jgi:hypothetical protein